MKTPNSHQSIVYVCLKAKAKKTGAGEERQWVHVHAFLLRLYILGLKHEVKN